MSLLLHKPPIKRSIRFEIHRTGFECNGSSSCSASVENGKFISGRAIKSIDLGSRVEGKRIRLVSRTFRFPSPLSIKIDVILCFPFSGDRNVLSGTEKMARNSNVERCLFFWALKWKWLSESGGLSRNVYHFVFFFQKWLIIRQRA